MQTTAKTLSDVPAINRFLSYCRVRTVPAKTVMIHAGDLPLTISAAGPYYLAENVIAPPGRTGIYITTSGVTLDLNGFSVSPSSGNIASQQTGPAEPAS